MSFKKTSGCPKAIVTLSNKEAKALEKELYGEMKFLKIGIKEKQEKIISMKSDMAKLNVKIKSYEAVLKEREEKKSKQPASSSVADADCKNTNRGVKSVNLRKRKSIRFRQTPQMDQNGKSIDIANIEGKEKKTKLPASASVDIVPAEADCKNTNPGVKSVNQRKRKSIRFRQTAQMEQNGKSIDLENMEGEEKKTKLPATAVVGTPVPAEADRKAPLKNSNGVKSVRICKILKAKENGKSKENSS